MGNKWTWRWKEACFVCIFFISSLRRIQVITTPSFTRRVLVKFLLSFDWRRLPFWGVLFISTMTMAAPFRGGGIYLVSRTMTAALPFEVGLLLFRRRLSRGDLFYFDNDDAYPPPHSISMTTMPTPLHGGFLYFNDGFPGLGGFFKLLTMRFLFFNYLSSCFTSKNIVNII